MQLSALFTLDGKVALITGGNRGIGLGMADALGSAGAHVVVAGRSHERNDDAVHKLKEKGYDASAITIDVRSQDSCQSAIEEIDARLGRLDILVNCAGMNIRKLPEDYSDDEISQIIDTNLIAPMRLSVAAKAIMVRNGGGKIINVGSLFTSRGGARFAPYAMSKGGLYNLTQSQAAAWASENIQVNIVLPGWIDTELTRKSRIDLPELEGIVSAKTPAGRWGQPEDLAGVTIFLASSASNFITGSAIAVDGGFSATV